MSSLIQNAEKIGIAYKAYALTCVSDPNNVFQDNDDTYFHSSSTPANQWWQVSFSKPVIIISYKIRANTEQYIFYSKSWLINISFNNRTWETVDDKTNQNTLFNFSIPIYCKHFRIVLRENGYSSTDNYLIFRFFWLLCV